MGILSQLFERRDRFTVDQELPDGHAFFRWFGGGGQSDAGVYVNETTALNSLLVVSCVRILAETVASLPLPVYRRVEPRGRERARDHSLYRVLHDEPNPRMTSFTFRERLMAHLALWGNAYALIERRRGDIVALWPVHPRNVAPHLTEQGAVRYRITGSDGQQRDYAADDVLHVPGLAMDGLVGLSPLAMMRQAVGLSVAAETYGARFFANDARPHVLLKHPAQLSDVARENLRQSWQELHGGGKGGVAILEEGMEFATVSMPPQDAQFLETRRFQVQEMARFYRIPPHLLADVERSTSWGSGIEHQNIGFVVYTMRPWLVRIEQEFTRKLIPPQERDRYYVEFLVDGLLRGDLAARKEYYATARQWGWMSINDVRELENQNPIENGDDYLQPMNMVSVGASGDVVSEPEPDTTPARSQEWRTALSPRSQRSATARRRLANAHRVIYRDVAARLLRIERQEVGRAIRRYLRERNAQAFEQWVRDYYFETFPPRIVENMTPPVRALMDAVAAEAADEVGSDPPDADTLDRYAAEYVDIYASRHAGDSRARLLKRIQAVAERGTRQDDELAEVIEAELDEWDDRAERIAEDETHRSGNAVAKFVFGLVGVTAYRWITAGDDPCDYCQNLSGRVVSGGDPFIPAGHAFAPGGIAPFVSQYSIGHPPLHTGCQCIVAPG